MSILQPLRRIVGANQEQPPSEVKMTLVLNRYRVPLGSNSSALTKKTRFANILRDTCYEYSFVWYFVFRVSRMYVISEFIDWGRSVRGNIKKAWSIVSNTARNWFSNMPQKINISSFSSKDNLYLVAGAQVI